MELPTTALRVMRRSTIFTKLVSILIIQTFILSNVAFALPKDEAQVAKQREIITNPAKVVIPREFGLVKSQFTGNDGRLVVHIQDAHCNYEAQSNIVKILESLVKNYSLTLISVEGADGDIDTSWFKAFPDDEIRKEVATYFMKKGEITGPEFLSITSDYSIKLFGAETRSYYIQNLNAFTSSYPLKEETERYYTQIKNVLNRLKQYIYSSELKEMDRKFTDYESKKIQFNEYVRFLQDLAERQKINLREYDNFFKLVSTLVYEKKIDFNVTDKERSNLIDEISKKITKEALTELVTQSISFKAARISSVDYYHYLRDLATKNGIDVAKNFPNLYNYIIYNSVYSKIENEKLFNDIKKVETAVKERLFKNDDQKTLEKLSRHVDIVLGLINIKLLNGDFEYYEKNKQEFSYEAFSGFISKKTVQYGFAYEVERPSEAVVNSIPKLEDFYSIAIKRDRALVDNTLNAMKKERQQITVLVTGGFHSEGIAKLLEKQGVSYMVVCPSITKDVPTPYIQILTNQRTPLEDILVSAPTPDTKQGGMLAPYIISAAKQIGAKGGHMLEKFAAQVPAVDGRTLEDRVKDFDTDWSRTYIRWWIARAEGFAGRKSLPRDKDILLEAFKLAVGNAVAKKHIREENKELIYALADKAFDEIFAARAAAFAQQAQGAAGTSEKPASPDMAGRDLTEEAKRPPAAKTTPGRNAIRFRERVEGESKQHYEKMSGQQDDEYRRILKQSFDEGTFEVRKIQLGDRVMDICIHYGIEDRVFVRNEEIAKHNKTASPENKLEYLPIDIEVHPSRGGIQFNHALTQLHLSGLKFFFFTEDEINIVANHELAHINIANGIQKLIDDGIIARPEKPEDATNLIISLPETAMPAVAQAVNPTCLAYIKALRAEPALDEEDFIDSIPDCDTRKNKIREKFEKLERKRAESADTLTRLEREEDISLGNLEAVTQIDRQFEIGSKRVKEAFFRILGKSKYRWVRDYITDYLAHRTMLDYITLTREIASGGDGRGFDVYIFVSTSKTEADYWQERFEATRGQVLPKNAIILSVYSEGPGRWHGKTDNGSASLYAFTLAEELLRERYGDAVKAKYGKAMTLFDILKDERPVIMMLMAGKGKRMQPMGANNKSAIALLDTVVVNNERLPITVGESVARTFGPVAASRGGRLTEVWGDQINLPGEDITSDKRYAGEIFNTVAPFETEEDKKYAAQKGVLIFTGEERDVLQREKPPREDIAATARRVSGINVADLSLGFNSYRWEFLRALLDMYKAELRYKRGYFNIDSELWAPLTFESAQAYASFMWEKRLVDFRKSQESGKIDQGRYNALTSDSEKSQFETGRIAWWGRIRPMLDNFNKQYGQRYRIFNGRQGVIGRVDFGFKDKTTDWWDYGQIKNYYDSLMGSLFESADLDQRREAWAAERIRRYFGIRNKDEWVRHSNVGETWIENSIVQGCSIARGHIKNCIIIDVTAEEINAENAIIIGSAVYKLDALEGFNIAQNVMSSDPIRLKKGDVLVSHVIPGQGQKMFRVNWLLKDTNNPNNYEPDEIYDRRIFDNPMTFAELSEILKRFSKEEQDAERAKVLKTVKMEIDALKQSAAQAVAENTPGQAPEVKPAAPDMAGDAGALKVTARKNMTSIWAAAREKYARLQEEAPMPLLGTSGQRGTHQKFLKDVRIITMQAGNLSMLAQQYGIQPGDAIVFAGDLRPSTSRIAKAALLSTLQQKFKVNWQGFVSTPTVVFWATTNGTPMVSIMVTASHNPVRGPKETPADMPSQFENNGLKLNSPMGEILKEDEPPLVQHIYEAELMQFTVPDDQDLCGRDGKLKTEGLSAEQQELVRIVDRVIAHPGTEAREAYRLRNTTQMFVTDGEKPFNGEDVGFNEHTSVARDALPEILEEVGLNVHRYGRDTDGSWPERMDTEDLDENIEKHMIAEAKRLKSEGVDVISHSSTDGDADRPALFDSKGNFIYGDKICGLSCIFLKNLFPQKEFVVVVTATCSEAMVKLLREKYKMKVIKVEVGSPFVVSEMEKQQGMNPEAIVVGFERNTGFFIQTPIKLPNGNTIQKLATRDSAFVILSVNLMAKQRQMKTLEELVDSEYKGPYESYSWSGGILNTTPGCELYTAPMGKAIMRSLSPRDRNMLVIEFEDGRVLYTARQEYYENAPGRNAAGTDVGDRMTKIRDYLSGIFTPERGFGSIMKMEFIDGVRVFFDNGEIVHLRPSGNEAKWRIYPEARKDRGKRAREISEMRLQIYPQMIADYVKKTATGTKREIAPRSVAGMKASLEKLLPSLNIPKDGMWETWKMEFGPERQHLLEKGIWFGADGRSFTIYSRRTYNKYAAGQPQSTLEFSLTSYPGEQRVVYTEIKDNVEVMRAECKGEKAWVELGVALDKNVPVGKFQDMIFPVMSQEAIDAFKSAGVAFFRPLDMTSENELEPSLWGPEDADVFEFRPATAPAAKRAAPDMAGVPDMAGDWLSIIARTMLNERTVASAVKAARSLFTQTASPVDAKMLCGLGNIFLDELKRDKTLAPVLKTYFGAVIAQARGMNKSQAAKARDLSLIAAQALNIISWMDRDIKPAKDMRLTADESEMVVSNKGKSFISKNAGIPVNVTTASSRMAKFKVAFVEGEAGFYYRGIETVGKMGNNISQAAIYDTAKFEAARDNTLLYLMDHGFIAVPSVIKSFAGIEGVGTIHETAFVADMLPGSIQYASTGPGHLQMSPKHRLPLLDIKHVTEGTGIQYNKFYDETGKLVKVIAQYMTAGSWVVALPGAVESIENLGGLRFNDFSLYVSEKQASDMLEAIHPGLDFEKIRAAEKTIIEKAADVPYYAVNVNGVPMLVQNPNFIGKQKEIPPITWVSGIPAPRLPRLPLTELYEDFDIWKTGNWKRVVVEVVTTNTWATGESPIKTITAINPDYTRSLIVLDRIIKEGKPLPIMPCFKLGVDGYTWGEPIEESSILAEMNIPKQERVEFIIKCLTEQQRKGYAGQYFEENWLPENKGIQNVKGLSKEAIEGYRKEFDGKLIAHLGLQGAFSEWLRKTGVRRDVIGERWFGAGAINAGTGYRLPVEVLSFWPEEVFGAPDITESGITAKHLTSARPLSVQYHRFPEMIIPLEEGDAYIGLSRPVTGTGFVNALRAGDESVLKHSTINEGEGIVVPAGMPHAYGRVRVYEVKGVNPAQDSKGTISFYDRLKLNDTGHGRAAEILQMVGKGDGKITEEKAAELLVKENLARPNKDVATMTGKDGMVDKAKVDAITAELEQYGHLQEADIAAFTQRPALTSPEFEGKATRCEIMGSTESFVSLKYTIAAGESVTSNANTAGTFHTLFAAKGTVRINDKNTGALKHMLQEGEEKTLYYRELGEYVITAGSKEAVVYTQYKPSPAIAAKGIAPAPMVTAPAGQAPAAKPNAPDMEGQPARTEAEEQLNLERLTAMIEAEKVEAVRELALPRTASFDDDGIVILAVDNGIYTGHAQLALTDLPRGIDGNTKPGSPVLVTGHAAELAGEIDKALQAAAQHNLKIRKVVTQLNAAAPEGIDTELAKRGYVLKIRIGGSLNKNYPQIVRLFKLCLQIGYYDIESGQGVDAIKKTITQIIGRAVTDAEFRNLLVDKIIEILPQLAKIDYDATAVEAYKAVRKALTSL